jgi:beta-glucanase (GH16 family)
MNWSGHEWRIGQPWGIIHPGVTRQWYDEDCVLVDAFDNLHLLTHRHEKEFDIDGQQVISPFGIGLITSVESFSYGTFRIVAKLPTGQDLFPAFWLGSNADWPPEIDVFEATTADKPGGGYLDFNFTHRLYHVTSNEHYGDYPDTKAEVGAKRGFLKRDPAKHFMEWKCHWTRDRVEIWYDGRLVRTIDQPDAIRQLNETGPLFVILNNAVKQEVPGDNYSDFTITEFEHIPL